MSILAVPAAAVLSGCFLSGAMVSLSIIGTPVLMNTTDDATQLLREWECMYGYGHQIMPAMSITTFSLYSYVCLGRRRRRQKWLKFALGGLTTLSMVPFTWLVMTPTNNELFRLGATTLSAGSQVDMGTVRNLVVTWTRLHSARSLLPLAGAILGTMGCREEAMI